jgi:hypothetical protein|tara:strand:+ start:432 stop:881 length:450 start_codon:yes stop_codon:yes gene_type:complete
MADLTTTITESVTLNGSLRGSTNSVTQTSVIDVFERIVTCTQGQETTVAVFAASPYTSAGAIDQDRSKYIRITNLSTTEDIEVAFVGSATLYQVKIRAGYSHVLSEGVEILLAEADTSPSFGTMESLASIIVKPVGATDVQCEVFVGLV